MEIKKIVFPKEGYSIDEFKDLDDYDVRRIIVIRGGVKRKLPSYTHSLGYDADFPSQVFTVKRIHYGGKIIKLEPKIPENKVADGINPYYQIIQRILLNAELRERDLIKQVLEKGYLPKDKKWSIEFIKRRIKEMEGRYLSFKYEKISLFKKEKIYSIGIPIETKNIMRDLPPAGYEIVSWHIMNDLKMAGGEGLSLDDLKTEYVINRRWINTFKEFEEYIKYLKDLGCIKIEGDIVKFNHPLVAFKF